VLTLRGDRFTCGRANFVDFSSFRIESSAKVYVSLLFQGLPQSVLAQLDTGAAWSILAPDIVEASNISIEDGDPALLRTILGTKRGRLVRIPFTFVADEGESLTTEGIFFVTPDWPHGFNFLGYSGLLDRIRFALDPQVNHFYFGPGL
jgi:hypothetical protein